MPFLKKLSSQPGHILPKIDNIYGNSTSYSFNTGALSPLPVVPTLSYSMIVDSDGAHILTSEDLDSDSTDTSFSRPRKRQRLDHLSQEEKVMRRKLKNRVAAQSARDRKKAKMTELEEQVSELETEKLVLRAANSELRNKNKILEKENIELKRRLGLVEFIKQEEEVPITEDKSKVVSKTLLKDRVEESRSVGHASLISVPLQKEQDLKFLTLWMMQFVYLPAITRLMTFLICYSNVAKIFYNVTSTALCLKKEKPENNCQVLKWWGPHQKAWNPSKN